MIRVLLFLLAFGSVGAGASSLPPRAGPVDLAWAGFHITTTVPFLFACIALITLPMLAALSLVRFAQSRFQRGQ